MFLQWVTWSNCVRDHCCLSGSTRAGKQIQAFCYFFINFIQLLGEGSTPLQFFIFYLLHNFWNLSVDAYERIFLPENDDRQNDLICLFFLLIVNSLKKNTLQ